MEHKTITTKSFGWIGDILEIENPLTEVMFDGKEWGRLFKTREDARIAVWKKPKRVEITVRIL